VTSTATFSQVLKGKPCFVNKDPKSQVRDLGHPPDEKKGERIVVVCTLSPDKLAPILEKLPQCDLPALWKPRASQFFHVDALPLLGTGKIDLRGVKGLCSCIGAARRGLKAWWPRPGQRSLRRWTGQ
jgi:hypothetical protein